MMKLFSRAVGILFASMAVGACAAQAPAPTGVSAGLAAFTQLQPMHLDATAPDVTYLDEAGNAHQLSENKGKYIVLYFYRHDCPICTAHLPLLDAFAKSDPSRVAFVPVERTGADEGKVDTFRQKSGVQMPLFHDPSQVANATFQVTHQPWAFLISSDFVVRDDVLGAENPAAFASRVARYAPAK